MGKLIGYEKEKKELAGLHAMLRHAAEYRALGIRIPRGLMLYGEPGVGKTMMAKSLAGDGIALVELRAAACCGPEAVDAVENVFHEAKETTPCVLLLDELDKIAGTSNDFFMENNENVHKTLLQLLDSLQDEDEILVVATCNQTENFSSALLRPGRFDRVLEIKAPDEETRRAILEGYLADIRLPREVDLGYIAQITNGYTGAKLECLANEAGILAMGGEPHVIREEEMRRAINRLDFGTPEERMDLTREELYPLAVHEAGHALTGLLLAPETVYGASIMAQGNTSGHVRMMNGRRTNPSLPEVENMVITLLAGHVAERVMLGHYMAGAEGDMEQARQILYGLVHNEAAYGYEYLNHARQNDMFMSKINDLGIAKTAEILQRLDGVAEGLIRENRALMEKIVEGLLARHVLTHGELRAMLAQDAAGAAGA